MKYLGKIQDPKDLVTKEYVDNGHILNSKTYTGVIGTANDWANATFFFGVVKPTDFNTHWKIRYRVYVQAAGDYRAQATSDFTLNGINSTYTTYKAYNSIINTSYRPAYYHVYYRATSAGMTYGHAMGIRLYSSWNPITAANARTIKIEILEVENCTFTFFNSMTKYASIPGTGSTNYAGYTEFNFADNGLRETGDDNTTPMYLQHYNNILARKAIAAESLIVGDSTGYEKVGAGVTFDITYPIVWCTGAITINTSNYANMFLQHYDRNMQTGIKSGYTSAANKVQYLVVSISGKTATIDETIVTDTLPVTDNGKVYIELGKLGAQSTGANYFFLYPAHHFWWYKNGGIRQYGDYGHAVNKDVPSNAVFTDTVTTVSTTGSGNAVTAISASNGALTVTKGSTFLTSFTETDPTVPSWAKAASKPSYTAAEVGAVADCTLSLYNGQGGNPGVAKFCTVNYTGTDSNNGVLFKTTFMAGHGNGVSYNHLQDCIISVSYQGAVSVDIYRYYAQTVTYSSATHYYGDVLYTVDTTNKVVTFYTLMGQYSTTKFSPYKRLNASNAGTITQHTGTASMGASGTVSWATVKWIGGGGGSGSGTVTSVAATGSGGITISGSPITTSGTLTIGVDGSTVINNLSEGTSPADRNDYIVAQSAGGGTTKTSYYRRKLSNIFAALNSSDITTALGYTPPTTDHTYNFSGTTFYSGNSGTAEHNANSAVKNGNYYYTSNGPTTTLGASTTDGALYVQSYSDSWVGQIAQDYRNGGLFVRGKNNGTWQSWQQVYDTGHTIKLNEANLPRFSGAPQYLLGIDAFADGGTMKWQGVGSISVGYATSAGSATDSTKLPLAGGTLTGRLTLNTFNTAQVNMRPNNNSYDGIMSYQTDGNEAWVFSTKNAVTSFMFVNGEDTVSNVSDSRWKSLTPGLQVKNNCVSIGKLIGNGVTPSYKLDVNGTVNFTGLGTNAISNIANMFVVEQYSFSAPAISSGSSSDITVTRTKSGYHPLSISGFQTGKANTYFAKLVMTQDDESFTIRGTLRANAAVTAGTGYVYVLWVKRN